MSTCALSKKDIQRLFGLLNEQLVKESIHGELYLVGGAVMCLVYQAREMTWDVDAFFKPSKQLRSAAQKVARENDLPESWLNDGVKGFFSEQASFNRYMEYSNLIIYAADPAYLLAMKCLATRIGEEFHDIDDIRYLLRYLNLENVEQAKTVITRYYSLEKFPQKTLYLLDELFPDK
ncbi:MAG: hypothetical protein JXA04_12230 [Gammaproteobacteria bacterium]|nr:hypothetical protein [Gammaproteobacteria bacterium]